jgi:hypothetical protein
MLDQALLLHVASRGPFPRGLNLVAVASEGRD